MDTTNNTGATATTSASDGKNTGAGAAGADTQAATTGAGAGAGAIAGAAPQTAPNSGQSAQQSQGSSEEEIQRRIDDTVKKRLAEEKDRAEKKQKEAQALADGKYQELLAERDKELAAARQELQSARLRNQVIEQAHAAGISNITVLMKLIKDDVEFDENGVPQNVDKLVKAAVRDVPGLAGNGAASASAGSADGHTGGTTRVEVGATNPAKTTSTPQTGVNLFTPGLFKV